MVTFALRARLVEQATGFLKMAEAEDEAAVRGDLAGSTRGSPPPPPGDAVIFRFLPLPHRPGVVVAPLPLPAALAEGVIRVALGLRDLLLLSQPIFS